jgi:hypothetical protein
VDRRQRHRPVDVIIDDADVLPAPIAVAKRAIEAIRINRCAESRATTSPDADRRKRPRLEVP